MRIINQVFSKIASSESGRALFVNLRSAAQGDGVSDFINARGALAAAAIEALDESSMDRFPELIDEINIVLSERVNAYRLANNVISARLE